MTTGHRQSEEGASATLFLISLTALLAVTMLAIDGGSLFVSRRGQIAETDSAALASALLLVGAPCATQAEVNATADDLITQNGATTMRVGDVEVTYGDGICASNAGTVTVATTNPVDLYFAPLFGYDELDTGATTTVAYGQVNTLPQLRPIGICGLDPHYLTEWQPYFTAMHSDVDETVARTAYETAMDTTDGSYATSLPDLDPHPTVNADGIAYSGADVVHRLVFQRLATSGDGPGGGGPPGDEGEDGDGDGSDCPGASGNFGWLDFDDGGGGNAQLADRIRNGYEGDVTLGTEDDGDEDCDAEDPPLDDCPPQTGAHGSATQSALDAVTCPPDRSALHPDCQTLYIVVYSDVAGSGGTARFDLQSFAGIVLRGHDVGTGQLGGENYLDIEFVDDLAEGPLSPAAPGSTAPFNIQQCAVDGYDGC